MTRQLIILEGPDCAGKTTLANQLLETGLFAYTHFGNYLGITRAYPRFYLEGMLPAINDHSTTILDRCWLSEEPYGKAFRGGMKRFDDADCRMLERVALTCDAVVIYCDPGFESIKETFMSRKDEEYLDTLAQLKEVHAQYPKRLKRSHLPVIHYDYHIHTVKDVEAAISAHKKMNPFIEPKKGIGSHSARVVLVGDSFANHTDLDIHQQFPFVSFGQGCSRWLATELDRGKIPEQLLWWVNQDQLDDNTISDIEDMTVIALGTEASDTLKARGVKHQKVEHPQFWRRFKQSAGIYPLIKLLQKVLHAQDVN